MSSRSGGRSSTNRAFSALAAALAVAAAALAVAAAAPNGSAARLACGRASPAFEFSRYYGPGVRVGPVYLVGFGARAVHRLVQRFPSRLFPVKVLVYAPRPLTAPVTMRGSRCADGRALTFWYRRQPLPFAVPASEETLRAGGDREATFRPGEAAPRTRRGRRTDYRGYVLFSGPGTWKIELRRGDALLGTAYVRVLLPRP